MKNAAQAKASILNEEGLTRLHVANGDGKRLGNASIDAGTFFSSPSELGVRPPTGCGAETGRMPDVTWGR